MAGRPRSMVRKVLALEEKANKLGEAFYNLTPKMYLERAERQMSDLSPINVAWCDALTAVTHAYLAIGELRELLEERANALPDPLPNPYVPPNLPPATVDVEATALAD